MNKKGFTLIEIIVAVGIFAMVMVLAAGSYLVMIGVNRQTQSIAAGIDNLAFALETMTRTIRTGTNYSCTNCRGGSDFSVTDSTGKSVTYGISVSNQILTQTIDGVSTDITDSSIKIDSLKFWATGVSPADQSQARVMIIIHGAVSSGPGKTEPFTVQTGATMRGSDL